MRLSATAFVLALICAPSFAQLSTPDPDWREAEVPAPAPLKTTGLIPFEVERATLRYAVDPSSIGVGADRIVRYVVVASSDSGAVNAMYEGIRCNTAEVKLYARHNPAGGWVRVAGSEWRPLHGSSATRHSLILARTAVCVGHAPNQSAEQIARDLASPINRRFLNEVR